MLFLGDIFNDHVSFKWDMSVNRKRQYHLLSLFYIQTWSFAPIDVKLYDDSHEDM